jgi:segregation and condensation protein A
MSAPEISLELYNSLENIKNTLFKNRFDLLELNLTRIVLSAQKYLSLTNLNEIFLEFLIRLSEAIYLKSCLLLNVNVKEEEKLESVEALSFEENFLFSDEKLNYYKALPLDRILFEKVFLGRLPEILENFDKDRNLGKGERILILKAILSILNQEEIKEGVLKNFSSPSIEFYLNSLKEYLGKKISFTFKELINEKLGEKKGEEKFLEVVYYFLSLLFLCFEEVCYIVQNHENEDIIIFSKS